MPLADYKPSYLVAVTAATAGLAAFIFFTNRRKGLKGCGDKDAAFEESLKRQETVVVDSVEDARSMLGRLVNDTEKHKVLGLDCEWTSDHAHQANPVALLQLASSNGLCVLFRLCKVKSVQDLPELAALLSDRSILKVGVGILGDSKKLLQDYGLVTKGCVDLRHLALRHLPRGTHVSGGSLAELSQICLNFDLDKSWRMRCSDWEASELTDRQVEYAALDAYVAVAIFYKLIKRSLPGKLPDGNDWSEISALCQGLVDAKFKGTFLSNSASSKCVSAKAKRNKAVGDLEQLRGRPLSKVYVARKEPLYDNCKLVSPDGTLLCTCDRRKAEWYVHKDIGEMVSEQPLVVRLKFEPAGIPGPDREYYLQEKSNMCVVCGRTDSYIRKNIVPHEYRRHFPDYLKNHSSHDVLLLCVECHQCSWTMDSVVRQQLAEEYDAPINNLANAPTKEDPIKTRVKSAAKALSRNVTRNNLPTERVKELQGLLLEHFKVPQVDDKLLGMAVNLDTKVANELFEMYHGEKVVKGVSQQEDGFAKFEKRWRVHFLKTMQPKYMPALWSVDHKHESQVAKQKMLPD